MKARIKDQAVSEPLVACATFEQHSTQLDGRLFALPTKTLNCIRKLIRLPTIRFGFGNRGLELFVVFEEYRYDKLFGQNVDLAR